VADPSPSGGTVAAAAPPPEPTRKRRNRPLIVGTVDADTRLIVLGWVAEDPQRRSVGQWIDRAAEKEAGFDREHIARDTRDRHARGVKLRASRVHVETILRRHQSDQETVRACREILRLLGDVGAVGA
jgi:hypothetical protein